ncbi:MAG: hydantoinase/oxoprolinase family protein [Actinomycetota bacterium]
MAGSGDAPGEPSRRVAVDTGGTFTDFVYVDAATGRMSIAKLPSTPDDPSDAIVAGIGAAESATGRAPLASLCHGTTVATNALLEERGARAALVVTANFRGIYEVMEQARPYGRPLFDLGYEKPAPLVPPSRTIEAKERVDRGGEVLESLDEDDLRRKLRGLPGPRPEAVAVCLLFSFMNPAHERRIEEIVSEEWPGCTVSPSCDVLPQIREYHRLSTTVINAYLAPRMRHYLVRLEQRLDEIGASTPRLYVMQSNGGTGTIRRVGEIPAATILSGPAGGVTAGVQLAETAGHRDLITFDMGGTSCDVSLVSGATPSLAGVGAVGGRHIALPMIDINTVSAGGGTLAWVDDRGLLQVGPQSAGAVPGPACYGCGGEAPTVTDANLVLGYLSEDMELGGSLRLQRELAVKALESVSQPLGIDVPAAAEGIVRIVNTKMGEAIKAISTARGFDLRDFTLVAFGGAGPVHAGALLELLGMRSVLIPAHAGVFSSLGLLMADVRRDYVRSRLSPLDALTPDEIRDLLSQLVERAAGDLIQEGFEEADRRIECSLDMRYEGQGYELTVPWPPPGNDGTIALRRCFDDLHEGRFGHRAPDAAVEVVSYRAVGYGLVPRVPFPRLERMGGSSPPVEAGTRQVRCGGGSVTASLYHRGELGVGDTLRGPAIVSQPDCTTVVEAGQRATVDDWGNLLIVRDGP